VPDSRVTVPIEIFAQTMRSLFPRYASASDERLIDIFASEYPQCRLVREGANVSLENLSYILESEAGRQVERATPRSEPTSAVTSRPVLANELIESEKPKPDEKESGETAGPSDAMSEAREQENIDDDDRLTIPSFGHQEETSRPVALWVACGIGALALCGTGVYYAHHAKVENHSNPPLREAAPVPAPAPAPVADADARAPESAPTVEAPQAEVVTVAPPTAAPPVVVKTDPYNSLPAIGIDQLFERFHAEHGERDFVGKKIRIRGKIEMLGAGGVSFMGHESPLIYWFDVHGFGDKELSPLKQGDTVEVVCEFTGNRASTGDTVMRWSFDGLKIRKVSQ
jgi:hypothetical protein